MTRTTATVSHFISQILAGHISLFHHLINSPSDHFPVTAVTLLLQPLQPLSLLLQWRTAIAAVFAASMGQADAHIGLNNDGSLSKNLVNKLKLAVKMSQGIFWQ